MQPLGPALSLIALLAACCCLPAQAHGRLRSSLPHDIDPGKEKVSPLQHVEEIAEPIEDIELRQKPAHVLASEVNEHGALMASDLTDLLNERRDDMQDCVVVHQYAEPLQVGDSIHQHEFLLSREGASDLPPVVRQGAIYDDGPSRNDLPLQIEMFANLEGITGMVQVIPHGPMAKWTSKQKVPIGGFLCSHNNQSVSAPVLHATPTPCIPTAIDATGRALDPLEDGYEVFIGTTRVKFDSKEQADWFCVGYAKTISTDLSTTIWDASKLGTLLPQKNPSLASFVAATGVRPTPEGWTKGRKKLLVVVMDWKSGDKTLSPYSKQDPDPIPHYRSNIFPKVAQYFEQMSYGQFGIEVSFVPEVIRYTRERNRYTARKMPFPALYDAARDAVEGQRSDFKFDSYDLVYVIAPQVKPTGTKGVAWVGMKGAMCNGCETISDKFKIMVAVHELGHNLGLLHASSTALEYGNPFDWMGNYPDVVGLNYGLGYVVSLGWLTDQFVYNVKDADLPSLSSEVIITPHDVTTKPAPGQVSGVKISLSSNARDLWISYRSSPEGFRSGVYLTLQAKDEANSELIDCACHSPSQQDANLRVGWTFLDRSHKVAVTTVEVTEQYAKVHIYAVSDADVPKIYGQPTFTDGETKCPVTCQDANWLVTSYDCPSLKTQGYCDGGAITLQGTKYSIGKAICPQECNNCDAVMGETPLLVAGGCQDSSIQISGKDCRGAARAGWCDYETKGGSSVGKDLCPASCGQCPKTVRPSSGSFTPPQPTVTIGAPGGAGPPPPATAAPAYGTPAPAYGTPAPGYGAPAPGYGTPAPGYATPAPGYGAPVPAPPPPPATPGADTQGDEDEEGEDGEGQTCNDDPSWTDKDGDGCAEYAQVIKEGKWTQSRACSYGAGAAKLYCRKTCETCSPTSGTCADNACIATFKKVTGRCEQCADWSKFCTGSSASWMKEECPLTCGVCKPNSAAIEATVPTSALSHPQSAGPPESCHDDECVVAWKTGGKCPTCQEMGDEFCAERAFAASCRETCNLCTDGQAPDNTCKDVFSAYTCSRYKFYGWCTREDMRGPVSKQCPFTCGLCGGAGAAPSGKGSSSESGSGKGSGHEGEEESGHEGGDEEGGDEEGADDEGGGTKEEGKGKGKQGGATGSDAKPEPADEKKGPKVYESGRPVADWPPPRGESDVFGGAASPRLAAAALLAVGLSLMA